MRAKRKDANHSLIQDVLEQNGWSCADTSALGNGFPDIVAAKDRMRTVLIEVKDGEKPPSKQRLTEDEERFRDGWRGEYLVLKSLDDVLRCVGGDDGGA